MFVILCEGVRPDKTNRFQTWHHRIKWGCRGKSSCGRCCHLPDNDLRKNSSEKSLSKFFLLCTLKCFFFFFSFSVKKLLIYLNVYYYHYIHVTACSVHAVMVQPDETASCPSNDGVLWPSIALFSPLFLSTSLCLKIWPKYFQLTSSFLV